MNRVPVGIAGFGQFGRNHLRVLRSFSEVEIAGVADPCPERLEGLKCPVFFDARELIGRAAAVIVAAPTVAHAEIGCALLEGGADVLVEKPIASDLAGANALIETAKRHERILQVGHLERFNPGVRAVRQALTLPLFFEIHRMSVFTPRSLDVDVVLDLMIHDVDIVLAMTGAMPTEVRAAGIHILSEKVDIANVRLSFENGCVANLTASRASTEKIRKLRLFQPDEYMSLDYARQDVIRVRVQNGEATLDALPVNQDEPLRLELASFLESVRTRRPPEVSGQEAARALSVCLEIAATIKEHGQLVRRTIADHQATAGPLPPSS